MILRNNTRQIEVNGKSYTLTAKRSIIRTIGEICPKMLKIAKNANSRSELSEEELKEIQIEASDSLYDNMPTLFYELIRTCHKDLTREKSDEIYYDFYNEYNDVDNKLIEFIFSVFTDGIPSEKKKNLDW